MFRTGAGQTYRRGFRAGPIRYRTCEQGRVRRRRRTGRRQKRKVRTIATGGTCEISRALQHLADPLARRDPQCPAQRRAAQVNLDQQGAQSCLPGKAKSHVQRERTFPAARTR